MKYLLLLVVLSGCSTMSNQPTGSGQFVTTFVGKGFGTDIADTTTEVMKTAAKQCGALGFKVVTLASNPPAPFQFPTSTLVYECK